jgi:hypothetical protein
VADLNASEVSIKHDHLARSVNPRWTTEVSIAKAKRNNQINHPARAIRKVLTQSLGFDLHVFAE